MKLIWCDECKDLIMIRPDKIIQCSCKLHAGKYLADKVTAVVTKDAIVVGIDNNSFRNAVRSQQYMKDEIDYRVDYFFCGWIPTIPGEVVYVNTLKDVMEYDTDKVLNTTSTMPTSAE